MKKLLTTLVLGIAFATAGTAQIQKGNLMLGASVSDMQLAFQSNQTLFSFTLNPKVGYFVEDNWVVGGELRLGLALNRWYTGLNYGIGAFGRYYFGEANTIVLQHARFFAEANAGIAGANAWEKSSDIQFNTNGLGFGFGPGVAYFITPNIGLEAMLKYNADLGLNNSGNAPSAHTFRFNIGFQIYLPNKKAKKVYDDAAEELRQKRSNKYPVETFD